MPHVKEKYENGGSEMRFLVLASLQPFLQGRNFILQAFRQVISEFREVFFDQWNLGQPALDVDAQQFIDMRAFDVEARSLSLIHI